MSQPRQLILKQHYRAIDLEGVIVPGVYRENDPALAGKADYLVKSGRAEWVPAEHVVVGDVSFFAGESTPAASIVPPTPAAPTETPELPSIDPAIYAGLTKAQLMELGALHDVALPKSFTNEEMIDALIIKRIVPEA